MNRFGDNTLARQDARNWSEKVGILAAQMPATNLSPFDPFLSADTPTRLSTILHHFRQRQQKREDAEHKFRAQEFISGQWQFRQVTMSIGAMRTP
jgi:hypothetical protein